MALSKRKRAHLVKHMGEARVVRLEKELEEKERALMAGGVDFKELLDKCVDCGPQKARPSSKGTRLPDTPGGRALAQFIGPSPGEQLTKELKEMAESPNPGARALAQIMQGAVQGG